MSAEENIANTKNAYAAFSAGDIPGALALVAADAEWVVDGNSILSGSYKGHDEIVGFWMKLPEKGFSTTPTAFFGDGDQVVVLTQTRLGDESGENADVLEFSDGMLVRFRTIGETERFERVFGTK
jgi:ketosteroid isomerase-like protein